MATKLVPSAALGSFSLTSTSWHSLYHGVIKFLSSRVMIMVNEAGRVFSSFRETESGTETESEDGKAGTGKRDGFAYRRGLFVFASPRRDRMKHLRSRLGLESTLRAPHRPRK